MNVPVPVHCLLFSFSTLRTKANFTSDLHHVKVPLPNVLNLHVTNELSHPSHLDESIFILRGTGCIFFIFISYFAEFHVSKQNSPRRDAAFSGVTSGAILFAYVP